MDNAVELVLQDAKNRVGVHEIGTTNTGIEVNKYLKSVGLSPGNPWCAAFVYYCFQQSLGDNNPWIRTGGCAVISAWARSHDLLRDTPQRGDVFLLYGWVKGIYRAHHTGFVLDGNDPFSSIEGNTNLGGSPDGIGVFERDATRHVNSSVKFVRWTSLLPQEVGAPAIQNQITINGAPFVTATVIDGKTMCPLRKWGAVMGFDVGWDNDNQTVLFDQQPLNAEVTILDDDQAYAPIRELAESAGLQLSYDEATHTINVFR